MGPEGGTEGAWLWNQTSQLPPALWTKATASSAPETHTVHAGSGWRRGGCQSALEVSGRLPGTTAWSQCPCGHTLCRRGPPRTLGASHLCSSGACLRGAVHGEGLTGPWCPTWNFPPPPPRSQRERQGLSSLPGSPPRSCVQEAFGRAFQLDAAPRTREAGGRGPG